MYRLGGSDRHAFDLQVGEVQVLAGSRFYLDGDEFSGRGVVCRNRTVRRQILAVAWPLVVVLEIYAQAIRLWKVSDPHALTSLPFLAAPGGVCA